MFRIAEALDGADVDDDTITTINEQDMAAALRTVLALLNSLSQTQSSEPPNSGRASGNTRRFRWLRVDHLACCWRWSQSDRCEQATTVVRDRAEIMAVAKHGSIRHSHAGVSRPPGVQSIAMASKAR